MKDERAKAILDYWFQDEKMWFAKDPERDRDVTRLFEVDLQRARDGEMNSWTSHAENCLALVLLLDQFSRNIHRGTAEAFASDAKAQATVLVSIARGLDLELDPLRRAFFYLPLMHSEDVAVQARVVELFRALVEEVPAEDRPRFEFFLDFALKHQAIVDRFGRFPHRNELLDRESTAEEEEFLAQPGPS